MLFAKPVSNIRTFCQTFKGFPTILRNHVETNRCQKFRFVKKKNCVKAYEVFSYPINAQEFLVKSFFFDKVPKEQRWFLSKPWRKTEIPGFEAYINTRHIFRNCVEESQVFWKPFENMMSFNRNVKTLNSLVDTTCKV